MRLVLTPLYPSYPAWQAKNLAQAVYDAFVLELEMPESHGQYVVDFTRTTAAAVDRMRTRARAGCKTIDTERQAHETNST